MGSRCESLETELAETAPCSSTFVTSNRTSGTAAPPHGDNIPRDHAGLQNDAVNKHLVSSNATLSALQVKLTTARIQHHDEVARLFIALKAARRPGQIAEVCPPLEIQTLDFPEPQQVDDMES